MARETNISLMILPEVLNGWLFLPFCLALAFAFSNGFRDSSTIVATVVSTRVLSPSQAFLLCGIFEFIGAVFVGSAVISTIASGIFGPAAGLKGNELGVLLSAALIAALLWGVVSWWRAWPTSNNQALVAGLFGAGLAVLGERLLRVEVIGVVLLVLIFSPLAGFLLAMIFTASLRRIGQWATPKLKSVTDALHVFSCMMVATAHGSNDGQMVMGVLLTIGFAVGAGAGEKVETLPFLMRLLVGLSISCGVLLGGRRILKKLGMKFYRIRPPQGVGSQMTAAATIMTCAATGFPASTTQVIAGSILGAGVAANPRAVRWHVAQDIVLSWVLTLPVVFALAYAIGLGIRPYAG